MSLSLVYRAARPSLLSTPPALRLSLAAALPPVFTPLRHASRSEQTRPQGEEGGKRLTYAERQKARRELAAQRPTYKIRKGKKDITQYPDEHKPQTRRARFYDPDSSFGKKSLVYQLKTGQLSDDLKALGVKLPPPATGAFSRTSERPDLRGPTRRSVRKMARGRRGRESREDVLDPVAELSRPVDDISGSSRREGFRGAREERRGGDSFRDAGSKRYAGPRRVRSGIDEDRSDGAGGFKPHRDDPISIPYTTAASQFLYGKSVVAAALRRSRRQLYKLYIYNGANRSQSPSGNAMMQKLAARKGVPTTILGEEGLRLMDKLANSRPHNGFVLEASALPQPPLAALGPIADDYASKPGYPVVLAHQSAEDAAINGTPSFIDAPTPAHKPLFVVLDRILDPGNLGAILRTVSFLGATGVAITNKASSGLTPVALKAASGAAETLALFNIASLQHFLRESRANGWTVYASVAEERAAAAKQMRCVNVADVERDDPLKKEPCILVIGNEGEGLDMQVVKRADFEVNIPNLSPPGSGVDSLNVSVAAGLLCSAFLRGVAKSREIVVGGEEAEAEVLW
ncbi:Alpha/beta knot methyltransferase [Staphylotrichum tortipilum]|uniref:rRNA methyltransferase 1, mitochondrial n=1 Tax=Staphylotrichum tortipilum TaxID=2831512 RepID=A0AAN6RPC4_9PEZI|nr:Alpha/beta knot methyltransferase [Staphylotrichum longicolle]